MSDQMTYPDEILKDLMKKFTVPHWTLLQILAGNIDEHNDFHSEVNPVKLSLKELNDRIELSPQNFRVHVGLLDGANAIVLVTGQRDQRAKEVVITANGLRMLELKLGKEN